MFNFFVSEQNKQGDCYCICDSDYNHIKNVLRMDIGDRLLISCNGKSDLCQIESFGTDSLVAKIIENDYTDTELPVKIYLFQGLPKGDKMEYIIQKCVELGVFAIIPVEMSHCVVKLDAKKSKAKQSRWQAISESAAKQSKRNIIPQIMDVCSYSKAIEFAKNLDTILVPYENEEGMKATKNILENLKNAKSIGIFIGPEGGFDKTEIEKAINANSKIVSLGKRILRTETAAICAVSMCMLNIEMMQDNI